MKYFHGNYRIDIIEDSLYGFHSADNTKRYDEAYLDETSYRPSTVLGITVFHNNVKIKNAIIGECGGKSGLHDSSVILEDERLLTCCSDSIFCLSLPSLRLLWRTRADWATCFEIFKHEDSYIVHGELAISMIDKDGNILWQQNGADIFTTVDGQGDFVITDDFIMATDWGNKIYRFDFCGNKIE